ncbi:MAG: hypothetical protein JNK56_12115, partial [Myxococcales bacterium]|nr:hypothetical protein [Myxococcales bacterium]
MSKSSRADPPSSPAPDPAPGGVARSVERSAELSISRGSAPGLGARLDAVPDPNDILSDAALRGRALPAALYTGTGVITSGALGVLSSWLTSGSATALRVGLIYLVGALALTAAIVLLRRGRSLLAARVAIVTWIATTAAIGLGADPFAALGLVPASLAV